MALKYRNQIDTKHEFMKNQHHDVTVCIPSCNGVQLIQWTLDSVLNQTEIPSKTFVFDDASDDGTVDVLKSYESKGIEIHLSDRRSGMVQNWNRCAQAVTTEFFCILHQDDTYTPNYLKTMCTELSKFPKAAFAYCDAQIIDDDGEVTKDRRSEIKESYNPRVPAGEISVGFPAKDLAKNLIKGNFICCPSVMYRKSAYDEIGPFSDAFRFVQDWDYWVRTCLKEKSVVYVKKPLFNYRVHRKSATSLYKIDFTKYEERESFLQSTFDSFRKRGWVDASYEEHVRKNSYNILLWDFLEDLSSGRKEVAKAKLKFAEERWPQIHEYALFRALKTLLRFTPWASPLVLQLGRWGAPLLHR